jgi:SulP family sulfate permease
VVFDLVVAIAVGLILTALLFIKKMSDVTTVQRFDNGEALPHGAIVPEAVAVYEIKGPMFFADTDKLDLTVDDDTRAVVVRMGHVPSIDASAMRNMEVFLSSCRAHGIALVLSHVNEQPMKVMQKSGFFDRVGAEYFAPSIDEALALASAVAEQKLAEEREIVPSVQQ